MRMKCLRILPETMPRISCSELSSLSLNMAFGRAVVTVASTSIGSDFPTMPRWAGRKIDGGNTRPSGVDQTAMVGGKVAPRKRGAIAARLRRRLPLLVGQRREDALVTFLAPFRRG